LNKIVLSIGGVEMSFAKLLFKGIWHISLTLVWIAFFIYSLCNLFPWYIIALNAIALLFLFLALLDDYRWIKFFYHYGLYVWLKFHYESEELEGLRDENKTLREAADRFAYIVEKFSGEKHKAEGLFTNEGESFGQAELKELIQHCVSYREATKDEDSSGDL
jgi:hypothetical protein